MIGPGWWERWRGVVGLGFALVLTGLVKTSLVTQIEGRMPENHLAGDILGLYLGAAVLLGLWVYMQRRGLSWGELGFGRAQRVPAALGLGVLVVAVGVVLGRFLVVSGWPIPMAPCDQLVVSVGELSLRLLLLLPVHTVLVEEAAFRGVLWAELERGGGRGWAFFWTIVAFTGWHLGLGWSESAGDGGALATKVIGYAIGGLAFGLPRVLGSHIAGSMLAHWLSDGLLMVAGHPVGGGLSMALLGVAPDLSDAIAKCRG